MRADRRATDGAGLPPVERVRLDKVAPSLTRRCPVDRDDPADGLRAETAADTAADPRSAGRPARTSPKAGGSDLTLRDAQLTSDDGASHLISLGEFAALYLRSGATPLGRGDHRAPRWCRPDTTRPSCDGPTPVRRAETICRPEAAIVMPAGRVPDAHPPGTSTPSPRRHGSEPDAAKDAGREGEAARRSRAGASRALQSFRTDLPKVQRALANVPTYMILDDHDVTDDFFLNPMWRDRVLGTALGPGHPDATRMLAYALFQDWGNDPRRYDQAAARAGAARRAAAGDLLSARSDVPAAPAGAGRRPRSPASRRCSATTSTTSPTPDGRYDAVRPPLTLALHASTARSTG